MSLGRPAVPAHCLDASFTSDNSAGLHPRVRAAILDADRGFAGAYGDDEVSERARTRLSQVFGSEVAVQFASTGTAANLLAIATISSPGNQVLCSPVAHVLNDEGGAIESIARCSMRAVPHSQGKVDALQLEKAVSRTSDIHAPQPRVLSIAQATELGSVYTRDELCDLCQVAHAAGLLVHLDGARLANAAASLGLSLRDLSFAAGADVVTFGTSKNGSLNAEVIIWRDRSMGETVAFRFQKQLGQLHSKQRFLATQIVAMLDNDLWLENARHANHAARLLAEGLEQVGATVNVPVQANSVFASLSDQHIVALEKRYVLLKGIGHNELRFMTSFATSLQAVDQLTEFLRQSSQ